MFRNILVPVDHSERAIAALRCAKGLAMAFGPASVDVLHVWRPPVVVSPEPGLDVRDQLAERNMVEHEAQRYLDSLFTLVDIDDSSFHKVTTRGTAPSRVIEERSKHYDLVVIGASGRRGLARVFLGSNAEKVVRECRCPVLVVPPGFTFLPRGHSQESPRSYEQAGLIG